MLEIGTNLSELIGFIVAIVAFTGITWILFR